MYLYTLTEPRTYTSPEEGTTTSEVVTRFCSLLGSIYDARTQQGTSLLGQLRNGKLLTNASIVSAYALASASVIQQLGDQSGLPEDQRIVGSRLNSHTASAGTLQLAITLATADPATKINATLKFN